jgi:hypothetical protein
MCHPYRTCTRSNTRNAPVPVPVPVGLELEAVDMDDVYRKEGDAEYYVAKDCGWGSLIHVFTMTMREDHVLCMSKMDDYIAENLCL